MNEELKPGCKLDARIAIEVMGWSVQHAKDADGEDYWDLLKPDGEIVSVNRASQDALIECDRMPKYSTDIAAAWEVVERLNSLGLHVYLSSSPNHGAKCEIENRSGDMDTREIAETMPQAICLAALKALEGK